MKIKKSIIFVMVTVILLLSACGKTVKEKTPEKSELEIKNTSWGMTVDEALKAYDVTKESASLFSENKTGAAFAIENGYEMFGEKTERIVFQFLDLEKGEGIKKLCQIDITYPTNADMSKVLDEMKAKYGDTEKNIRIYGMFQSLSDEELPQYDYKEAENLKLWGGSSVSESIPEEQDKEYEKLWENLQPGLTEENWEEFSENARLVTAVCASGEGAYPSFEKNGVSFNAYNLLVYEELKEQLLEK